MSTQVSHLLLAVVSFTLWLATCLRAWLRVRGARRATARLVTVQNGPAPVLVAHASQTGTAEGIAQQTAAALQTAGVSVVLQSFAGLDAAALQATAEALFVVSTYGEGDAPDAAAHFVASTMHGAGPDLSRLRYGLLALGDSSYRNFCGFGREFEAWLQSRGARPLFPRLDVDGGDPAALLAWRRELGHVAATTDLLEWQDVPFETWMLRTRQHLDPGSLGAPVFHLELVRKDAVMPPWQAGDLLQVVVPGDAQRPRDYSIASIPADGAVHLLVRQQIRDDGTIGSSSGWLTRELDVGATLQARLRVHNQFRIGDNVGRDLVLVGNGTGIAGLRAHLKQRALEQGGASPARRNWLLFGERQAVCDALYGSQLEAWRRSGLLARLDLVYSRDAGDRYVQDRLRAEGQRLCEWIQADAAIYVCGSLQGMAEGVEAVLLEHLGEQLLAQLQHDGRYRRDVY